MSLNPLLTEQENSDFISSFIDRTLHERMEGFQFRLGDLKTAYMLGAIIPQGSVLKYCAFDTDAVCMGALAVFNGYNGILTVTFPTENTMEWKSTQSDGETRVDGKFVRRKSQV